MLVAERQGRHRYHRLASAGVASLLESLMAVAGAGAAVAPRTGPRDAALRQARTCYDHLAGRVAVAIAERMAERGEVELSPDGGALTAAGVALLGSLGVELARPGRRPFCRPCLDWSERRPHIAGAVGAAILDAWLGRGWLRRVAGSRAVRITPAGRLALDRAFAFAPEVWADG